ncbi:MAG: hypothetical protein GWO03_00405, partial [Gammaproteobacteria bacterium]|nr:hypothetical protein [Gammaproteobacteria bacterium]
MKRTAIASLTAAMAFSACIVTGTVHAQVRTPEGAVLDTSGDLAYAPGELSEE